MKISIQYKAFLILSGLLLILNLLLMNDFTSVLEGAEANNIHNAQQLNDGVSADAEQMVQLPKTILAKHYQEVGFNLFLLRLPNVLLLILTLLGFFWWGKKLFGKATILLGLLVVSSTFLVVTSSKFVTYDIWLLSFQLSSFISLILLLKQPIWKWRILFWAFTLGAVFIDPKSALVFSFGMWLFLLIAHPNGKKLIGLFDVLMWLMTIAIAYFIGGLKADGSGFFFNYAHTTPGEYFLINLIGILPWLAFLPAAFLDLFQKLRKREEMAIIGFAFLLFSTLSYGLILQFSLALLIAKQVENYFKPNYPHTNLVKSFAVLNLFFSFFLVSLLLLTGYDTFGEIGFRSRMRVGGVYWAFGFLAIIGLFGNNKKMIVGSITLSGMLTMLLFWTQINPLLENYRNLPEKLTTVIEKKSSGEKPNVYLLGSFFTDNNFSIRNEIYLKNKKVDYEYPDESDSLKSETGIFVLDEAAYSRLDSNFVKDIEKIHILGRSRVFETDQKIWILKR